jgi:hypothetical protein
VQSPDTSAARDALLECAAGALDLLGSPALAGRWSGPSALPLLPVSGLAGHLADQLLTARRLLAGSEPGPRPGSGSESEPGAGARPDPIPLLEHYARAAWIGADLDDPVNRNVRAAGEELARRGPAALREEAAEALGLLRAQLPAADGDRPILIPWTGWSLRLDDFLATRTLELAVHGDDLAVSLGVPTPGLTPRVQDLVLTLLTRLAVTRHGAPAVLRTLSRAERAPASIAAI